MHAGLAIEMCEFPQRLHPVSHSILESYLQGALSEAEFLRFFSLPNSDYIVLARCFVDQMAVWL